MPRRFALFLVLLAALGACKQEPQDAQAPASPGPAASGGGAPSASATNAYSLRDALPSPTPNSVLPSMPPEVAGSFVFYDDFEKGLGRWQLTGGRPTSGWHLLKAATCGGLFVMVLGADQNAPTRFAAGESLLTLKQPIDLTKATGGQLQYDVKGVTNPPEAAVIACEVRAAGTTAWQTITPKAEARFPLVVTFTANLAPYLGKRLELRFRGITKPAKLPTKGFYLDDVHVVQPNPG